MSEKTLEKESFEAYRKSFSYGSRADLNFKFLDKLSDEEGYQFFGELLSKLGESLDDGDFSRIVEHVVDWQARGYLKQKNFVYDSGPFTPLKKSLSDSKLLLLTSSGHFVEGDDPEPFGMKGMTQKEAMARIQDFLKRPPVLSRIPKETPFEQLRVRHGGYDIHGSQIDPNVAFPLNVLLKLEQEGRIGTLADDALSFVGACAQTRLLNQVGPEWVQMIREMKVDIVLLVPV